MSAKVEAVAAGLRQMLTVGDDSAEAFLWVEVTALDRVVSASYPQGDSDADRLAEIRDIVAALRLVRSERAERRQRRRAEAA